MILETFPVGPLQCNCTILGDEQTREAMVIDPGDNIPDILMRLARHGLTLRQIVVTSSSRRRPAPRSFSTKATFLCSR